MVSALFDVVYPRRCAGCGTGTWPFCDECHSALLVATAPWCIRCGRPGERDVDGCAWCPPPPVAFARAPFLFRGPARSAIHRLKFAGWRTVAEALAGAMATVEGIGGAEAVSWVPLARPRRLARGYDQARALAEAVAARIGVPAVELIVRPRAGTPQASRGGAERRAAMMGAFAPAAATPPSRVLLVDDVLTTGATAAACAVVLARAGASEVGLLTAARAIRGALPARYTRGGLPSGSVVARERGVSGSRCQPRAKRPT